MSSSSSSNSNISDSSSNENKNEENEDLLATAARRLEGRQISPSFSSSSSSSTSPLPEQLEQKVDEAVSSGSADSGEGEREEPEEKGFVSGPQSAFTQYRGHGAGSSQTQTTTALSPTTAVGTSTGFSSSTAEAAHSTSISGATFGATSPTLSSSVASSISTPIIFGNGLFEKTTNGQAEVDEQENDAPRSGNSTGTGGGGGGFVFGQNLLDRVVNQQGNDNDNGQPEPAASNIFQTTDLPSSEPELFGASANSTALSGNASRAESTTGEENERNIIQLNCKLYIYDNDTSAWIERGQGQLRLNDSTGFINKKSRLILRVMGTLRLLLNTQIWEGIDLKRVGDSGKCLRFLGRDELNDQKIHVFMIKSSSKDDITNLFRAIDLRIPKAKKPIEQNPITKSDQNQKISKRSIPEDDDSDSSLVEYSSTSSACTTPHPSIKKPHLE